jgi:hypothetical protein
MTLLMREVPINPDMLSPDKKVSVTFLSYYAYYLIEANPVNAVFTRTPSLADQASWPVIKIESRKTAL